MAEFDFWEFAIDLSDGADRDTVEALPGHPLATLSFVHEYSHFLQSCSSLLGFNTLEQLISVSVAAAVTLNGLAGPQRDLSLLELLEALPDHIGQEHEQIRAKMGSLADEMVVLTNSLQFPYEGDSPPWDLVQYSVVNGTYQGEHWGFVTERRTFRPFTPLIAVEGISRRVDRRYAVNEGYVGHEWPASDDENEVYNGLRNVLLRPSYARMVSADNVDEITILVGSLALLAPHPDWSIFQMLGLIANTNAGVSVNELESHLRSFLIAHDELRASHFNQTMNTLLYGNALMIRRDEFKPIYEQLKLVHAAATRAIEQPRALFPLEINWQVMRSLMQQFSVPPVKVRDGVAYRVGGVDANQELHRLIRLINRKLF